MKQISFPLVSFLEFCQNLELGPDLWYKHWKLALITEAVGGERLEDRWVVALKTGTDFDEWE